jgi:alpha-1,2-mannosyltransferase
VAPVGIYTCLALALILVTMFVAPWGPEMLDLKVYRLGGDALLRGLDVYAVREPRTDLAFTYPIFAAVLFIPYAWLSLPLAKAASVVMSLGALWVLCYLTVQYVQVRMYGGGVGHRRRVLRWSVPVTLLAVAAHPVLDTLMFGQINLVTTALVSVDILLVRGRYRGALVGLATGLKLVSGLFMVYYLITRQFRAAATAAGTFAVTVALGFAVAPRLAWDFWTVHVFDPDRVGGIAYVTNQSILGIAARLLRNPHPPSAPVFWLSAVAGAAALLLARRAHAWGDEVTAVCAVAVGALLASPISWSHHWVWMVLGLAPLFVWVKQRGGAWRWVVTVAVTLVLFVGPMRFMPKAALRELHHNLAEQVVANIYGAIAVAFLVWIAVRRPFPASRRGAVPSNAHGSNAIIPAQTRREEPILVGSTTTVDAVPDAVLPDAGRAGR